MFSLSSFKGIIFPILLFLFFAPWSVELDLLSSSYFFDGKNFSSNIFWKGIYNYALIPAWIVVLGSIIGLFLSLNKRFKKIRAACLYLLLTFSIGAGLFVHAILKEHWGRPRPKQVKEFNGTAYFRPFYAPNINSQLRGKSFACGHASLGFYFFSLAFLGVVYHSKIIYFFGLFLGWSLGVLLSLARIAQGGHFLSDTLATALIMWLTAWIIAYLIYGKGFERTDSKTA